jgi:hypothetical protein
VLLQGESYGIAAEQTKAEKEAEQVASNVEERSVTASGQ